MLTTSEGVISDLTTTVFTATSGVTGVVDTAASGATGTATGATSAVGLSKVTSIVSKRQNIDAVSGVVSSLVEEVSGTLGGVTGTFGVGKSSQIGYVISTHADYTSDSILEAVTPLTSALSSLLGDLDNVVGGTVASVENILKALGITLDVSLLGLPLSL